MPKEKRESKVEKDGGKLDTEKHTLGDLVQWKPPGENTLQKKWNEKREQLLENMSCQSSTSVMSGSRGDGASAQRVVMNDDGDIVVLDEGPAATGTKLEEVWETADDGLIPKKLNSMSFRKNFKRSSSWTSLETDLFYEVMTATGTDFALMHDYITIRTRAELKKKFIREQKDNPDRVNEVLRNPCLLDESLQKRADRLLKKIEKEQGEKRGKRRRPAAKTTKEEGEGAADDEEDAEDD